jgi:hypothetical protein
VATRFLRPTIVMIAPRMAAPQRARWAAAGKDKKTAGAKAAASRPVLSPEGRARIVAKTKKRVWRCGRRRRPLWSRREMPRARRREAGD